MKWNAQHYLQFEHERSLAARELLSRVELENPLTIVDLGCGPGNSTELLAKRYPDATILGVDSSESMLAKARERLPNINFVEDDVTHWQSEKQVDLIFANALFQWVPDHLDVIAQLLNYLTPGGILALQMPDNLNEPNHLLLRDLATDGPWAIKLAKAGIRRRIIYSPRVYYNALKPLASKVDIWHSIYNHVLDGPETIIEWMKGTGLQSYLQCLDEAEEHIFLANYELELAEAYHRLIDGKVMFTFPRIFILIEV
jgi:trans-aconitate 2-methyltransferase